MHENANNRYQCPYCKQEYQTIHMIIQCLQIMNPIHRKCTQMNQETRYPAEIWKYVCEQNHKTQKPMRKKTKEPCTKQNEKLKTYKKMLQKTNQTRTAKTRKRTPTPSSKKKENSRNPQESAQSPT